jgi:hypothetical protein
LEFVYGVLGYLLVCGLTYGYLTSDANAYSHDEGDASFLTLMLPLGLIAVCASMFVNATESIRCTKIRKKEKEREQESKRVLLEKQAKLEIELAIKKAQKELDELQ